MKFSHVNATKLNTKGIGASARKLGSTLIELVIMLAILAIVGGVIWGGIMNAGSDWQRAEASAREFASNIKGATGKVSCAKRDTDGDRYCGCTIFMQDGSMRSVDCGCNKGLSMLKVEGCKVVDNVKMQGGRRSVNVNMR